MLVLACGRDAEQAPAQVAATPTPEHEVRVEEPAPSTPTPAPPEQVEPSAAPSSPTEGSGYGAGSGAGFGGRGKRIAPVRHAKAEITGALEREQVRKVVREHINEVRSCYNLSLTPSPNLQGRVTIEIEIGPDGKVRTARVLDSTIKDERVPACIVAAVEGWRFPRPADGEPVTVIYPFNLSPG